MILRKTKKLKHLLKNAFVHSKIKSDEIRYVMVIVNILAKILFVSMIVQVSNNSYFADNLIIIFHKNSPILAAARFKAFYGLIQKACHAN